ncbi:GNAT family N-acetyltransferase [Streptomyces albidoflavus]|jgi:GNAT superfamily N-acetyltransferase|uniref:GNAT family N-acetyltransferase n=1 Tax=Streptomyces albidoflavus TaxID=1886 RepID=UPI0020BEA2C8|nr:GNAT family N-acetyltransferase [Streptomyces albidoflavus]MCL6281548.1 GNAT family N-acetyltransferase [Streptomyces albidoflavus]WTC39908.1 GNAT family N-acetyltransferase [Streptomyces albidoflavus]WTC46030.1 GNAT family N-acetyltransferase [Streptomyces albidoflavus]WTD45932.1 GNAT family N-acetyltransferase [Streptomyces albidoflavus]WTD86178.1 GNAT family N-acetyltransferase [Streptomyces albidoflavus]
MEPLVTTTNLRRYGHEDLTTIRQTLLDIHADAYAGDMSEFDERFPWFVDHWGSHPKYACVIGYDGEEPVGFAYGAPAAPGREWWREHLAAAPERDATFSLSELMVRPAWRKTGVAEQLHNALLANRPENLAVLLVDPDHPKVQQLYETWGYRRVGNRQPFPDSPNFAVMLRTLPIEAAA